MGPAHDRDDSNHLRLAFPEQLLVEGPDAWRVAEWAGMLAMRHRLGARRMRALPILLMRPGLFTDVPDSCFFGSRPAWEDHR